MAIISFVEYSPAIGIHCTHSFFVSNPIIFSYSIKTPSDSGILLFTGRNGDIFFFHEKMVTKDKDKLSDLQMQILLKDPISNMGEQSRDVSENCVAINISPKSSLYSFIQGEGKNELNVLPNMVSHNDHTYLVFTEAQSIYFFDTHIGKERVKIDSGSAFIDLVTNPDENALD